MIIDDEPDILNLFHDYIESQGYSVTTFDNPLLALDEIKRKPLEFSVIITDIRMPGISGLELIKIINKINKDIKVIVMSAFELDDNNLKDITYHEYIQKPVRIPTLLETVNNLLI
jgi:DNA-binding NtrC family response regulator